MTAGGTRRPFIALLTFLSLWYMKRSTWASVGTAHSAFTDLYSSVSSNEVLSHPPQPSQSAAALVERLLCLSKRVAKADDPAGPALTLLPLSGRGRPLPGPIRPLPGGRTPSFDVRLILSRPWSAQMVVILMPAEYRFLVCCVQLYRNSSAVTGLTSGGLAKRTGDQTRAAPVRDTIACHGPRRREGHWRPDAVCA
jgi:hypothetical protein